MTLLFALLVATATYHIDPEHGRDAAAGTSPAAAWRTVAPLARTTLGSGDRILLRGRTQIAGPLRLKDASGVTIGSYGGGRAMIDGGAGDALTIEGGTGARVEDLVLVGAGRKSNDGRGLLLTRTKGARVRNVDVSGFRVGGLDVEGSSDTVIERVFAHDNGAYGISVSGGYGDLPRSRNVTVRDCRAIDNPGDPKNLTNHSGNGIVVGSLDGALVEFCEAANNGWDMPREGNGPVGIWAWNATKVTVQDCISHDNKSPGTDGGGFDLDGGVTDSVFQRNLSYGNAGAGLLLCQYEGASAWGGNVVRHNVSYEDGVKNFNSGIALYLPEGMTNMRGATVERNTIVNSRFAIAIMGDVPEIAYRDNVLVAGVRTFDVVWGPGTFRAARFERNLAWTGGTGEAALGEDSPFATRAAWTATGGRVADPKLRLPRSTADLPTDPHALAKMAWFRPLSGSPIGAGTGASFAR